MKTQRHISEGLSFVGNDYHKRYCVFCVVDGSGEVLDRGRIEHLESGESQRGQTYNLHFCVVENRENWGQSIRLQNPTRRKGRSVNP